MATGAGDAVVVGIDVGARALHVVGLDAAGRVVLSQVTTPDGLISGLRGLRAGSWVAIDAPAGQGEPRHRDDATLSPKFQMARCGEIALGVRRGFWVPWVTPPLGRDVPGWMATGFAVWQQVHALGLRGIEVYPYAAFRVLASGRLPNKSTVAGRRARARLLEQAGLDTHRLPSHDALDAAVAALVAGEARQGLADEVRCDPGSERDHDGSSIWLPRAR
jgi:predicted nuclease with RNAse H fold